MKESSALGKELLQSPAGSEQGMTGKSPAADYFPEPGHDVTAGGKPGTVQAVEKTGTGTKVHVDHGDGELAVHDAADVVPDQQDVDLQTQNQDPTAPGKRYLREEANIKRFGNKYQKVNRDIGSDVPYRANLQEGSAREAALRIALRENEDEVSLGGPDHEADIRAEYENQRPTSGGGMATEPGMGPEFNYQTEGSELPNYELHSPEHHADIEHALTGDMSPEPGAEADLHSLDFWRNMSSSPEMRDWRMSNRRGEMGPPDTENAVAAETATARQRLLDRRGLPAYPPGDMVEYGGHNLHQQAGPQVSPEQLQNILSGRLPAASTPWETPEAPVEPYQEIPRQPERGTGVTGGSPLGDDVSANMAGGGDTPPSPGGPMGPDNSRAFFGPGGTEGMPGGSGAPPPPPPGGMGPGDPTQPGGPPPDPDATQPNAQFGMDAQHMQDMIQQPAAPGIQLQDSVLGRYAQDVINGGKAAGNLLRGVAAKMDPVAISRLDAAADEVIHGGVAGHGASRTFGQIRDKYFLGSLNHIFSQLTWSAPDIMGMDPVSANNLRDVAINDMAFEILPDDQKVAMADALSKAEPVFKLIKNGSQYLIDSGRMDPSVEGNGLKAYFRRKFLAFMPETRQLFRSALAHHISAVNELMGEAGVSHDVAQDWLDRFQDMKEGDQFYTLKGKKLTFNTDVFKNKGDLSPETLKFLGEVKHGGFLALTSLAEQAPHVALAQFADATYMNLDQIKAETPNEPLRQIDTTAMNEREKNVLGLLAHEPVPRAVAEHFESSFNAIRGQGRYWNRLLMSARYTTYGQNPAIHAMWGMNDANSMIAAGCNPFNPGNWPTIARAIHTILHGEGHGFITSEGTEYAPEKPPESNVPMLPYPDRDMVAKRDYDKYLSSGAFTGGKLSSGALDMLADWASFVGKEQSNHSGSFMGNLMDAVMKGGKSAWRMGPAVMEGTSRAMQLASIMKAEEGVRLKDMGAETKMTTADAISHMKDYFYDPSMTSKVGKWTRQGWVGVANLAFGKPGIAYNLDVGTKQLPNAMKAWTSRPMTMSIPVMAAAALAYKGWAMGNWAHNNVPGAAGITPSDQELASAQGGMRSAASSTPHGLWLESPIKLGGKVARFDAAGGLPEYFLFNYKKDPVLTPAENFDGYMRSVAKNALLGGGNFMDPGQTNKGEALGGSGYIEALKNTLGNTGPGHFGRNIQDIYRSAEGAPGNLYENEGLTRTLLRTMGSINTVSADAENIEAAQEGKAIKPRLKGAGKAIIKEGIKNDSDPAKTSAKILHVVGRVQNVVDSKK